MRSDPGLNGKPSVVTDASSGVGAGTARCLVANRVTVAVHNRDGDHLNKVAAALGSQQ
jgi:NADP-dependent 3-hydroxy acid dehydrogenase YdfG